jgi:threonine aldolase
MDYIDLRSDTVTWPTPAMREAMANARVGDDVYGDDPTVKELEAESAELLGKEAGLFVASGTMGNLTAALTHCGRGDEMILGREAHIFRSEAGGSAALGGVHPHALPTQPDGTLKLEDIRKAIRGDDEHYPRTRLICLENTHNAIGGAAISREYTRQVGQLAREYGLKLHIDGARIFNAQAALDVPAKELVEDADSVSFCLSKGLCAPVGSVLVGSKAFIAQARRVRKSLGGGMRQVGVLAAAGLVAIREMIDRLPEDHDHACLLAEGLATIPHVVIDPTRVQTNMVFFDLADSAPLNPAQLVERLKQDYHILMRLASGHTRTFRAVTHYWIRREHVHQAIEAMRAVLS